MFVVLGTSTADFFVEGLAQLPQGGGEHFQAANLAFCDRPLRMSLGGNGANAAFALGRLGAEARLCSAVGDDDVGALLERWLGDAHVDMRWLRRFPDVATSTSMVLVDAHGGRLVFHHPGPYEHIKAADLPANWADGLRTFLVGGYPLMLGLRAGGCAQLLGDARRVGAVTAVDIGPAIGRVVTLDEIAPLLPAIDYLLANEHELAVCAGAQDADAAQAALLAAGAATLIVKRGERGALLCRQGERRTVPAFRTPVRQTVGAGDAFNAGFLFALDQGRPVVEAIRYGSAVAASIVASPSGILEAPDPAAIERMLAEGATVVPENP